MHPPFDIQQIALPSPDVTAVTNNTRLTTFKTIRGGQSLSFVVDANQRNAVNIILDSDRISSKQGLQDFFGILTAKKSYFRPENHSKGKITVFLRTYLKNFTKTKEGSNEEISECKKFVATQFILAGNIQTNSI